MAKNSGLLKKKMIPPLEKDHASFRDPAGFVFVKNGEVCRQINSIAIEDYNLLKSSGLYEDLLSRKMLITCIEKGDSSSHPDSTQSKTITHPRVPFISYPYEWTFSQLKDAALLTLEVQKCALNYGMTLKDASAFNIQFIGTQPILIDVLSFKKYEDGEPWVAYSQFCRHFLAPLAMAALIDINMLKLWGCYIDGLSLELATAAIPFYKLLMKPSLIMHLNAHARFQRFYDTKNTILAPSGKISKTNSIALIDNLISSVKSLPYKPTGFWKNYYSKKIHNYSHESLEHKKRIVSGLIAAISPKMIWDIGSNDGSFVRSVIGENSYTISIDSDYGCQEENYRYSLKYPDNKNILPLVIDIADPTPARGWKNLERKSLAERGPADIVMAMAICHHLAFSCHINFEMMAEFFSEISHRLIIEFVPDDDTQSIRMIGKRHKIFEWYKKDVFEKYFSEYFVIESVFPIRDSKRTIYLMRNKK